MSLVWFSIGFLCFPIAYFISVGIYVKTCRCESLERRYGRNSLVPRHWDIQDGPYEECSRCGKRYLDAELLRSIERSLETEEKP